MVYTLGNLQVNTYWVILECIRTRWHASLYALSEFKWLAFWEVLTSLPTVLLSSDYVLDHSFMNTPWVTFKWILSEWASIEYSLSDFEVCTASVNIRISYPLSEFQLSTHWVMCWIYTSWLNFKPLRSRWVSFCLLSVWLNFVYVLSNHQVITGLVSFQSIRPG